MKTKTQEHAEFALENSGYYKRGTVAEIITAGVEAFCCTPWAEYKFKPEGGGE